jgi:hypothetical protein
VQIWDVAKRKMTGTLTGGVTALRFSSDGKRLLGVDAGAIFPREACADPVFRPWDVQNASSRHSLR